MVDGHELLEHDHARVVHERVAHEQQALRVARHLRQLRAARAHERERLLDEHVLARGQAARHDRVVRARGRGHDHRAHARVGQRGVERRGGGVGRERVPRAHQRERGLVRVDHVHECRVGVLVQDARVVLAPVAAADERDADGRGRRGRRRGGGGGAHSDDGAIAQRWDGGRVRVDGGKEGVGAGPITACS